MLKSWLQPNPLNILANEITSFKDVQSFASDYVIKAHYATLGSFLSPRGKFYIDVDSYIDFQSGENTVMKGYELIIDGPRGINQVVYISQHLRSCFNSAY